VIHNNKKKRTKLAARRTFTLILLVGIFGFVAYYLYSSRLSQLNAARQQLDDYHALYEEIQMEQDFFQSEITKLQDEDYVAMLAREQYFKSLPGEIIFRISDVNDDEDPYYGGELE